MPRGVPQGKEIEPQSPEVLGRGSPPWAARPASPLPAPAWRSPGPAGDLDAEAPRGERKGILRGAGPLPVWSRGGDWSRPPGHPWLQELAIISAGGPGPTFYAGPAPLLTPFPTSRFPVPAALSGRQWPSPRSPGADRCGGIAPLLSPNLSPSSGGLRDIVFCF